jgi:hypothetical protein
VELVDGAQRFQVPVAADVQLEVGPAPRIAVQAACARLRRHASPGLDLGADADGPVEHDRRADQLSALGRRIVAQDVVPARR